ncbi:MAG: ankyrin repeat domain-containing protein [Planctomycetota bacterium]
MATIKPLTGRTNDFLRIVLPACAAGKIAAVRKYLEDERAFQNWIGPHGRTMLWEAARKGRLDVVQLLAEDFDADSTAYGCYFRETRLEVSPWLIATLNHKDDVAEYLDSSGSGMDFLSACFLGKKKFVTAAVDNDQAIANRPYVRKHRWNPYTAWPLQYAVVGDNNAIVNALLASGADASADPAILFDAISIGDLRSAKLLLAAGADPIATRHRDWFEQPRFNALARKFGHDIREVDFPPEKWPEIVDASRGNHNAPDDPQRIQCLIDAGHDVNIRDYKGKTALHRAAQAGFLKITRLLIASGADLEARSHKRETPMFDAAFYGRVETLHMLAKAGANLEARDEREETPAFAAVRGGQVESLKALVKLGADVDAVNQKGQSVRDVADRSNKSGINDVRKWLAKNK